MYSNSNINVSGTGSKPNNLWNRRLLLYLLSSLTIILIIILYSYNWTISKPIKKITVTGNYILTSYDITHNIDDSLLNLPKEKLILQKIKDKVKDNPYIKSLNVMHIGPDEINIEIIERIPVAIIVMENGDLELTDIDGYLLPYRLYSNFPDLPVLRNIIRDGKPDSMAFFGALNILKEISKPQNFIINHFISEVIYNYDEHSFVLNSSSHSTKIILGNLYNLETKMNDLLTYLQSQVSVKYLASYSQVDLRWANQVVVRQGE